MSNPILEKSLDEIIGEKKPAKKFPNGPKRGNSRINKPSQRPKALHGRRNERPRPSSSVPKEVTAISKSKPILRVKNIHPDLNGEDLSNLFDGVAPVEFVKFDPRKDDVAYVCFQYDHNKNNSIAISRFDGRKAMGENLVVESATSLADRIVIPKGNQRGPKSAAPGGKPHNALKKKQKPQKKSVDTLDEELSAYMSGKSEEELKRQSKVNKLDNEMDNYWNNKNDSNPNAPNESSNANDISINNPDDAADEMKLD